MSEKQERLINELIAAIVAMMAVIMPWAGTHNIASSKEASERINILIAIRNLLATMEAKKGSVSAEFVEIVREGITNKPTMAWINDRQRELATIAQPKDNTAIAIWRQAKINMLVKELSNKLSDEQKNTIKAKMVNANNDWADKAIEKLLKIKSS